MKKVSFFIIVFSIICTAFNKIKVTDSFKKPSDYRDSYTGSYMCKNSSTIINQGAVPSTKNSTLTITVSKDPLDSVLQISVGSTNHKFKLRSNSLIEYPNEGHNGGGFFATDSIRLHISYGFGGASRFIGKKN